MKRKLLKTLICIVILPALLLSTLCSCSFSGMSCQNGVLSFGGGSNQSSTIPSEGTGGNSGGSSGGSSGSEPSSPSYIDPVINESGEYVSPTTDEEFLAKYNNDANYNLFSKISNGDNCRKFYTELKNKAEAFHKDVTSSLKTTKALDGVLIGGDKMYEVFNVKYSTFGITAEEAQNVYFALRQDCPLFYWMPTLVLKVSDGSLTVLTNEDFDTGEERAENKNKVYAFLENMYYKARLLSSQYEIALCYHDGIINATDYNYEVLEGTNSSRTGNQYAWSIFGIADGKNVVCEGYAKTFEALLTASEIENIQVTGQAGTHGSVENHSWNVAKIDGKWYNFDVTWDDQNHNENSNLGIDYYYFMRTDDELIYKGTKEEALIDGADVGYRLLDGNFTFSETHFPYQEDRNIAFKAHLPDICETPYQKEDILMLKTCFKIGSFVYCRSGFDTVQVVNIVGITDLDIPEKITYAGREYRVTSIGGIDSNGCYMFRKFDNTLGLTVITGSLSVPKSVTYIFKYNEYCLNFYYYGITVAEDNPVYKAVDNVITEK